MSSLTDFDNKASSTTVENFDTSALAGSFGKRHNGNTMILVMVQEANSNVRPVHC